MNLSKRLTHIRSLHHETAHSIWDIGCDHGLLGLSFLGDDKVKLIHLVDPSSAVVDKLKKTLLGAYITIPDKIKIILKRGQEIELDPQLKTVFIAGMGGTEIIEIMAALQAQLSPEDRLVISPHRKVLEVRAWLMNSDFRLISEDIVLEDGQFYPLLCLSKDKSLPMVGPYGLGMWSSKAGQEYLKQQLQFFSIHQDEASQAYTAFLRSLST